MITQTRYQNGAEKFALFQTSDGQLYLRALKLPFHKDIFEKFEKELRGTGLTVTRRAGAKISVTQDAVYLHDFSAAWGFFPSDLKSLLFELIRKEFPGKEIIDRLMT